MSATAFHHEALVYGNRLDGFERAVAPLVSETLEAGGTAVVAAPADRVVRLRSIFGERERLELMDMTRMGVNPARIIPVWRDIADRVLATGGPLLGVGEPVWVGRTPDELVECHRHEALINVAFRDDPPWRLVCPYDADGLGAATIEDARTTHPVVTDPHRGCAHADVDGAAAFHALGRPLSPAPAHAATLRYGREHLSLVREVVTRCAATAGLSRDRASDLALAATELATNSIRHGGGTGTLTVWDRDGAVVCQTEDGGRLDDPMAGRRRPGFDGTGGRGLWIVHQLCDLVQIRDAAAGTTIRVTIV